MAANITLNGLTNPTKYIFFTDNNNILSLDDDMYGSLAHLQITLLNSLASETTDEGQWYVTVNGETITSTLEYNNAVNKNFYVGGDVYATAAYIVRALRNCPTIAAAFDIHGDGSDEIYLYAKQIGDIPIEITTNIPDTYIQYNIVSGTSSSDLNNALVDVDLYNDGVYYTTLEKNAYNAKTAFYLSNVLDTIAEYGVAIPFSLQISAFNTGNYYVLGNISDNLIVKGYKANDSLDYIKRDSIVIAQNIKGKLYIYDKAMPVCFYNYDGNAGGIITVKYYNSLRQEIYTYTTNWHATYSSKKYYEIDFVLDDTYLSASSYIEVSLGNEDTTYEYEVIKPIKATEENTRVYWRNEYGGQSFFDFSGEKSFSNSLTNSIYQKNVFDYYTSDMYEDRNIYDKSATTTITLKSHLIGKDGIWIFNSLKRAKKVWTADGKPIIIESVNVEEQTNTNDVYVATITYTYSDLNND